MLISRYAAIRKQGERGINTVDDLGFEIDSNTPKLSD